MRPLIGIVGRNGSGKTTVCHYLRQKGFAYVSLSDFVRHAAKELDRPLNRESLIQTANELKSLRGLSVLADMALELCDQYPGAIVVDSIRLPEEAKTLKSKGFQLIGLSADMDARFSRIQDRAGSTDDVSYQEFKDQDDREGTGASKGQSIDACFDYCEHQVINQGSIDELHEKIDAILEEIRTPS